MNTIVIAAVFGLAAAGLVLIVRGLVGTMTPLAAVVAELHRPRTAHAHGRKSDRLVEWLAGRSTSGRDADLAVCDHDVRWWVQQRLLWCLLGAVPGSVLVLLAVTGTLSVVGPITTVLVLAAGAVGGWFYARVALASDAERSRREFRHALAGFLELVTILLAGGAGVETAMFDAAAIGRGPAFRQIRAALSAAQARRQPPWRAFGELGTCVGVAELDELEASMNLAGAGAQVRESLTAKAASMRVKDLAQVETEAQTRSETMVLPVVLMFAGFLLLIGYPALAALSTP